MSLVKNNKTLLVISLLLIIMPFFWLKPGEMDLGGDGGRLYFYDPVNQIKNLALYYVSPFNRGTTDSSFSYIPFIGMLVVAKQVISSSYILISLHNSIKLAVGFLAIFAIVREIIPKEKNNVYKTKIASIIAGLFYLSTPAMIENYIKAIPSHSQVFLNPLMFYLFLRFSLTGNMKYMWSILVISLIFATNFSWQSAPPFFAFYPIAFIFILLYVRVIRQIRTDWRKLFTLLVLFFGLHSFHLVPGVIDMLIPGSHTNARVFDANSIKDQIGYFYAILHIPNSSFYLLSYSLNKLIGQVSFVFPLILVFGLLINKKRDKTILLIAIFFLLVFFFATGKITNIGTKLYEFLFYIPGFSMFRNFYGQWQFVYYFFYSLFLGVAFYSILSRIRSRIILNITFFAIASYFVISSWKFINGSLVNPFREEKNNIKVAIVMDPKYEQTLNFIRLLPSDGKILVLPFTDSYMQVIHGVNNGAFVGHSTIGQLTGKKDFAGYQEMVPYSSIFWELSKKRDYGSIRKILGLLNIKYIFHNSDVRIYDTSFLENPYSPNYVRKYMPSTQLEYKEYIKNISDEKVYENSFYSIYKINEKDYLPHFYTPEKIFVYEDDPKLNIYSKADAFFKGNTLKRPVFIENKDCKILLNEKMCNKRDIVMQDNIPEIEFEKINPTKYRVKVFNAKYPYMLILSESFHNNWKIYLSDKKPEKGDVVSTYFDRKIQEGKHKNIFLDEKTFETLRMKSLPDNAHFVANGYANGWYITPRDVQEKGSYELIVEMTGQRIFYIGLATSSIVFVALMLWGIRLFFFSHNKTNYF
ncbi:hypothetical protein C4577_03815 [Candidatus Parcubacteria bacterium]|nr:MAG: hypothetical protein C4577_03815 [Candidatus Parcubacteria bacterium]